MVNSGNTETETFYVLVQLTSQLDGDAIHNISTCNGPRSVVVTHSFVEKRPMAIPVTLVVKSSVILVLLGLPLSLPEVLKIIQ